MNHSVSTACCAALLAAVTSAQIQATTLDALCRDAERAVRARVVAARTSPELTEVRLAVLEDVFGAGAAELVLREPAGRACGRALHGVLPGAAYVAFLRGEDLASKDSRALVPLAPGLVAHVAELRVARGPARIAVLAAALGSPVPRVREDAALALPLLQGLERADLATRARITAALAEALTGSSPELMGLLGAVARTRDEGALDLLVPAALRGRHAGFDRALTDTLARFEPALLARRVAADLALPGASPERAAALAAALPDSDGAPLLAALAAAGTADAAATLRRRGVSSAWLLRIGTPPDVVRTVDAATAVPRSFRSIDPSTQR